MNPDDFRGITRLLIMQPTQFCNIDCDYCYLPSRNVRVIMSLDIVEAAARFVAEGDLPAHDFTIVWHAGEPLIVSRNWYRDAFERMDRVFGPGRRVPHAFQTNGILIDDAWCELFLEREIRVGVSLDGPAFLHDARRKTRRGEGTFSAVMRGIRHLQNHGIKFHIIAVASLATLDHATDLIKFFRAEGIYDVGFNIEEIEGPHKHSTLSSTDAPNRFRSFFIDLLEGAELQTPFIQLREAQNVVARLASPQFRQETHNSQNTPLALLTIGVQGQIFTYSPELAGLSHQGYPTFEIGRLPDATIQSVLDNTIFQRMRAEINAGTKYCRLSCEYFDFCLGGAPVNKLFELGTFSGTETMACRISQKALTDAVLTHIEAGLQ